VNSGMVSLVEFRMARTLMSRHEASRVFVC
jgi:hypothetical protein